MEETKLVVIKNDQAEQDWWDYGGKNISPLSTGLKYKVVYNRNAISSNSPLSGYPFKGDSWAWANVALPSALEHYL